MTFVRQVRGRRLVFYKQVHLKFAKGNHANKFRLDRFPASSASWKAQDC